MPVISVFFGITIRMYYREHEPPHFHAEFQGRRAVFDFTGRHTGGEPLAGAAHRLVRKWAGLHRNELETNWQRMKAGEPLDHIAPLE